MTSIGHSERLRGGYPAEMMVRCEREARAAGGRPQRSTRSERLRGGYPAEQRAEQ